MSYRCVRARVACAIALALSACAGVQSDRYASLRERVESRPERRALEPSELGPGAELSRPRLVASVLARNPGIDAARAGARAALERYPQETALPDPRFGYAARPRSFDSDEVDPANDFMLEQSLPFPGKLGLRGERALSEAEAAESELERERSRLASIASIAFDAYWLAERALETNEGQRDLIARSHEVSLSRYASGSGSQQDVLAAQTEQAMLDHRRIELEAERRIAVERINVLLHRSPDEALPAPPHVLEVSASHELDEQALVTRALEIRPELRASRALVRAREADVALARREFLPDFTLRGAYEGSWQEDALKPVVGIELNVPLQLGRRRAALAEAEARLERERSRQRRAIDQVRLEVTVAVERVRESLHLLDVSAEKLLPAASARSAGARAGFASGRVAFFELIEAERALRGAQESVLEARAGVSRRQAELARALGDVPEEQP